MLYYITSMKDKQQICIYQKFVWGLKNKPEKIHLIERNIENISNIQIFIID